MTTICPYFLSSLQLILQIKKKIAIQSFILFLQQKLSFVTTYGCIVKSYIRICIRLFVTRYCCFDLIFLIVL